MNAAPLITSGTGQFKAVCHKCQYVGFEPNTTRCPTCDFPMLLEPYESAHLTLREILDRSTIELANERSPMALPGVNRTERQRKEMLARAQRRLSATHHDQPEPAPWSPEPVAQAARAATPSVQIPSTHQPSPPPGTHAHAATMERDRPIIPLALALMTALAAAMVTVAASGGF